MCYLPSNIVSIILASLFVGKLGYGLAASIPPRFSVEDPLHGGLHDLQVCINSAARAILRETQGNRTSVATLLARTGLPSLNGLMVRTVAVECWRALNVLDGPDAQPSLLADLIGVPGSGTRLTRFNIAGMLSPPSTSTDTLVWAAYRAWNLSENLRQAATLSSAKRAAISLAALAPL